MKPTLLVMAAGLGSRYGGLKQIEAIGPNGEIIIDYAIYDAIRAGFGKLVFVIRHYFEDAFKEKIALVRPGITGLWQIRGRSELSFEERITIDEYYIRNWSIWLDITILIKSLRVWFTQKGAY